MERVAVVGLGNISTRHRKNLRKIYPTATIYGMSASGKFAMDIVSDCDMLVSSVQELISLDVQFVIVASPATYHAIHTIPLIQAGIPVLLEKPVAASVADCALIYKTIIENDTPIAVGYCLRYLPSASIVKTLINEKRIGYIYNALVDVGQYLPDWRPNKSYKCSVSASPELGGGVLLELSHEFDYIRWLLGELNVEHAVLRSSEQLGLDVEDSADIILRTESDCITSIHMDFLQRKPHRKCRFIGSEGTLEWDLINNSVSILSGDGKEVIYLDPEWDKNQMYIDMIVDFAQSIKNGCDMKPRLTSAICTVSLIEEIKTRYPNRKIK